MQSLTGMDWLKKWIGELEVTNSKFKAEIEQITSIEPSVYNEFREWTPLKLILLNYSLNVCTTIIKNTPFFKHRYYIDLFAGSGINKIKGKDDFIIGSPLIASLNHSSAYDSMIFCEKENSYSDVLQLRLKILNKKNLELMKKEYESCLDGIIKRVNGKDTYSFFFIDPHCTEFKWEYMKKVLKVRSDIVFTFMTSEIYRAVGLARSGFGGDEILRELFGDNSWDKASNADELVEIYKNSILKERLNSPIRVIRIRSEQFNFYYHIFFITNKTKGENQWLRAIDKAKYEIESNSDIAVKTALDIVKKRQSQISQFQK